MSKSAVISLEGREVANSLRTVRVDSVRVHSPQAAVAYQKHGGLEPAACTVATASQYVYMNRAYVGNIERTTERTSRTPQHTPCVVREQYWACSRWPSGQRIMAVVAAVLLGAVVSLALTLGLSGRESELVPGIFRGGRAAPH